METTTWSIPTTTTRDGRPVALVGLVPVLVGFAWMLRIFRGPHDEPPAWRYRDR